MQNFRAKVREFGSFSVGNFRYRARAGHHAWVRRQHAIHIRPNRHFISAESRTQNCRGIVGTAASQSRELAVQRSPNEPCYHRNDAILQQRPYTRFAALARKVHERLGTSEAIVSH